MKVLLVNPYIYDFTAFDLWLRPLGLLYIASIIKKYTNAEIYWIDVLDRFQDHSLCKSKEDGRGKFHREIVDKPEIYKTIPRNYSRYGMPVDNFIEKLNKFPEIDIILITTLMTYWIDGINFTIEKLRERFPKTKIFVGGLLPTLLNSNIKEYIKADSFIKGHGEEKVLKIIKDNNGKIYNHPDLSYIDNLPFPLYELLANKKYLPLMTSRGCPYNCSYCASKLLNEHFTERSYKKIVEEIYYMYNKHKTEHFIIFDDAFLVNKETRFRKVFNEVIKNLDVKFHTPNGIHAKEVDKETAEMLYKSGFKTIRLSFESINPEILSKSSNKVTIKEMIGAVNNLEKAGFKRKEIECYILFGIFGQKIDNIIKSLDFVKEQGIIPHLSYFSPVPQTIDFINLQKLGILSKKINLYETNKIYFVYKKSGLSIDEIKHIKDLTIKVTQTAQNK